ncbi:type 1 glutamine amidotransferase [Hoeflea sp.]|uniref:type 1 glutamine amidotransferase n=1 Tax=Hoeflea sp. TaxID=1940281 RepID=UPI0019C8D9C4|nr:type 1 glutamine amidotransferase [Hoeflea sp.]MBC7284170.1 type 1 glutamine amidotransferase [Hoeflea sp.]
MRFLVIQHSEKEHAGAFRAMFERDGHQLITCNAPLEINTVDLSDIDGLWVLGGPMQVWQTAELPWLAREIEVIRHAVLDRRLPYFGICLGHQLLAHALGGKVSQADESEIGLHHVGKRGDPSLLSGVSERFACFQWHSAEISQLPEGAEILAASGRCGIQAMGWGTTASSVQFHAEMDAATLRDWYEIEECEKVLRQEIGDEAVDRVFDDLAALEAELGSLQTSLYSNWMSRLRT